jgi:hypothetical protein
MPLRYNDFHIVPPVCCSITRHLRGRARGTAVPAGTQVV